MYALRAARVPRHELDHETLLNARAYKSPGLKRHSPFCFGLCCFGPVYSSLPQCTRGGNRPKSTDTLKSEKLGFVPGKSYGVADEETNDRASGTDRLVEELVHIAPPLLAGMGAPRVRLNFSSMQPRLKRGVNVHLSLRGRLVPARSLERLASLAGPFSGCLVTMGSRLASLSSRRAQPPDVCVRQAQPNY